MAFGGLRVASLVCAVFLAGCQGDLYVGSTAPEEYWISAGPQAGTNETAIDRLTSEAARLCPGGYHKFSEQMEGDMPRWGIHCGDTFGDDSVSQ